MGIFGGYGPQTLDPWAYQNGSGSGVYGDQTDNPYAPSVGIGFGGTQSQRYGFTVAADTVISTGVTLAAGAALVAVCYKSPAIYSRGKSMVPKFMKRSPSSAAAPSTAQIPTAAAAVHPGAAVHPAGGLDGAPARAGSGAGPDRSAESGGVLRPETPDREVPFRRR